MNRLAVAHLPIPRLLAFALPLGLYAASLRPGPGFWDTGELQTVAYILGIAHPCGFPAFVLAGWLFSHAFAVGEVAWRLSLMCAIAMASAALLAYDTAVTLGAGTWAAAGSALLFAAGSTAWTHATRTEVHAVAIALAALTLSFAVRWSLRPSARLLGATALTLGLALGNYLVAVLLIPGVALLLAVRCAGLRAAAPPAARLLRAGALVLVGPLLYAYLPLRSWWVSVHRLDPTLTLGIPPGRPYWDYDHPSTLAGFWREVTGSDFTVGSGLAAIVSPSDYGRIIHAWATALGHEYGVLAAVLALVGAIVLARRDLRLAAGLVLAACLPVPFGLSYISESDVGRYLLSSFWLIAVLGALGASAVIDWALTERDRFAAAAAGVLTLALALSTGTRNAWLIAQRHDDAAARFIDRVIAQTPDNAVIVAEWAYAPPLAYAAYVERRMGHRIVETSWPDNDEPRMKAWARTRPVIVIARYRTEMRSVRLEIAGIGDPLLLRVVR